MGLRRSAALALLVAGVLAGCGDDDDEDRATRPAPCATAAADQRISVAPRTVRPAAAITVRGSGWAPDADVTLLEGPPRSEADPVAEVRTDADGTFRAELVVSALQRPGERVVLACRCACRVQARATYAVIGS